MIQKTTFTRRDVLDKAAATAVAIPWIIPATALGGNNRPAPSDRITVGAIGYGGRGRDVLGAFMLEDDVQCLGIADCFANRRQAGKRMVDEKYGNQDCLTYRHHEELLSRDDLDAVIIATGDRWHSVLSVMAAQARKDVYCEKPFCLTIGEGRAVVEATKTHQTVWQCGTQRRSNNSYRFVVEVVRSGKIGRLHTATTFLGTGFTKNGAEKTSEAPEPETFDYDRWTGQAPLKPYSKVRVSLWRHIWATGGGLICDMGPHYFDTVQWAHDSEMDAPRSFAGTAAWPSRDMFSETPYDFNVQAEYTDGVKLVIRKGEKGIRFDGDEGWIHVTDGGAISASSPSILADRKISKQSWLFMKGHIRNFLDCMRSRDLTVSNPELSHRTHTICHCANTALRLHRKVEWDPTTERFLNDDEANQMLVREMREPWQI